jgi:hypothetical protein
MEEEKYFFIKTKASLQQTNGLINHTFKNAFTLFLTKENFIPEDLETTNLYIQF